MPKKDIKNNNTKYKKQVSGQRVNNDTEQCVWLFTKIDKADKFAADTLLDPVDYKRFIDVADFSLPAIKDFASRQLVPSYIVIGRLQKEKLISYNQFSAEKLRYNWAE